MRLTDTELKVYNLIVKDRCFKRQEIADKMGLTVNTVAFHLGNIYTKLGLEHNSITNIVFDYEERLKKHGY